MTDYMGSDGALSKAGRQAVQACYDSLDPFARDDDDRPTPLVRQIMSTANEAVAAFPGAYIAFRRTGPDGKPLDQTQIDANEQAARTSARPKLVRDIVLDARSRLRDAHGFLPRRETLVFA